VGAVGVSFGAGFAAGLGAGLAVALVTAFVVGLATTGRLPAVAAGRAFETTLADFVEVFFLLEVLMLGKDRLPC
jgi:hypothetical protein